MIGQVCESFRGSFSPSMSLSIDYDAESIYKHVRPGFCGDPELISQAIHNLADNAAKYSYRGSRIRIVAYHHGSDGFSLAVTNRGIPILPNHKALVKRREWRGDAALRVTGEGNGLGLWITDNIMKAHGGELQVFPTRTGDGITEFRLAFPGPSTKR